ncbi:hypothetical protein [Companilactobacillus paralimentarius]|uniref:hypothetical protein n=1 Tax=Companilactobacillus paralimentarius TaxID=83526 RepID=UPI00186B7DB0|nr:hypothetical protein [Companilactobacillus paralimentarius]
MAIEDNQMAYYSSLPYPNRRSIHMLSGRRFSLDSNKQYKCQKNYLMLSRMIQLNWET